jgi:chaperonin GroEL (HSP60 family)
VGGAMQDSLFIDGVAFKKTFSYAGFEQQPKHFENPKILCLNIELELKAEKDNAEVRVKEVSVIFIKFRNIKQLLTQSGRSFTKSWKKL